MSYWQKKLQVQSLDGMKKQTLNPNNPYMSFPSQLMINNIEYSKPVTKNFVLKSEKNEFYNYDSSSLNQPRVDNFGDLQMLKTKKAIFPQHLIKIETVGCEVVVRTSPPAVDNRIVRFLHRRKCHYEECRVVYP